MPKTIGIVGTRSRNEETDLLLVARAFLTAYEEGDSIVSGGCPKGGDRFASAIAHAFGAPLHEWLPNKSHLDPFLPPKVAYMRIAYERNTLIARDADVLIACVAEGRKGGTEDTINKFCAKLESREKDLIASGKLVLVK